MELPYVIHVCTRVADLADPIGGATTVPCDQCGALCWCDPQSCAEITPLHAHGCIVCYPPEESPEEVRITRASVERARRHLQRRWN